VNAVVRALGRVDYEPTWRAMQDFTRTRGTSTPDELWLVEHPPVFTLGLAGREEHVLDPGSIPVVRIDRGGQVTYHGPGQIVAYPLVDLRRTGYGVKELVRRLEESVIALLEAHGVRSARRPGMPGVYVDGAKVAAVGLRISRGCSYHGIALNVDMDLAPFARINPCGYPGLAATRLADLGVRDTIDSVRGRWEKCLITALYDA
jgi:lipoyl(octanoyl) transferase